MENLSTLKKLLSKKKKYRILILSATSVILILYIYSNSGLDGIYTCSLVARTDGKKPYLIFKDGKIYSADYNGEEVRFVNYGYATYFNKDSEYYYVGVRGHSGFSAPERIYVGFFRISWKTCEDYFKEKGLKDIPEDDLNRVFNPILKYKIYSAIDKYNNEKKFIDTLWLKFKFW